ncbi:MAG: BtrH N-terminal domain-containing protein [Candidatus Bathyarchaeia archaeon]
MRKTVKGFVHRQGVHCDSSALRDVFEHHGFKFSEPMIFGLGSGLGFVYWKSKHMPFPFVGGRVKNLAENLCSNLGVTMKISKTASKGRAYETLKELISRNIPVMIHVDMPYLNYLGLSEEAHFGAHSVVVAGIDEEEEVVYIADTNFKGLQTATLEELEKARSSKAKPFPPQNKWFTFNFPSKLSSIHDAIKRAVEQTLKNMLNPPIKNLGIKGIRHLASELLRWPRQYPPKQFAFGCEMTYIYLEEAGTGGGCFRHLYSRFLEEAGNVLKNKHLVASSKEYYEVGKKWTEVAHLIKQMPQTRVANSRKAKDLLLKIADDEERILCTLNMVEM